MKKLTSILTILSFASMAQAQLVVDSQGKAAFATTTNSSYQINVLGDKNGINCTAGNSTTTGATAVTGTAYHSLNNLSIGVKGTVEPHNSFMNGFCVGVYGQGNASKDSKNIGVYGSIIPYYNGTGLYASSSNYNGLHALGSRYAGYFDGDTYVGGGLTVTGVFLNPSSSSSSMVATLRQYGQSGQSLTSQLRLLEPTSYYLERAARPDSDSSAMQSEAVEAGESVHGTMSIPLTLVEKQALSKQHFGLDAGQLEEVFPDLVYDNEDGEKSINYVEMVPILIQAINELSAKVETLEGYGAFRKIATVPTVSQVVDSENVAMLVLGENRPNPFNGTTVIPVSIPNDVQQAFIYVYDLTGKKVQQQNITARGKHDVTLDASALADGMYLYSLIADGRVVQTRRMIVEK